MWWKQNGGEKRGQVAVNEDDNAAVARSPGGLNGGDDKKYADWFCVALKKSKTWCQRWSEMGQISGCIPFDDQDSLINEGDEWVQMVT